MPDNDVAKGTVGLLDAIQEFAESVPACTGQLKRSDASDRAALNVSRMLDATTDAIGVAKDKAKASGGQDAET